MGGRPTLLDIAKGAVESFVKVCASAHPRVTLLVGSFVAFACRDEPTQLVVLFIFFSCLYRLDSDLQRAEVIDTCC